MSKNKQSTNKRYFYKCPIVALYMMQTFGVELADHDEEDLKTIIKEYQWPAYCFEIRQESESILLPKEGDLGVDELFYPCEYGLEEWFSYLSKIEGKVEIIMRDGKHFFNAEIEDE